MTTIYEAPLRDIKFVLEELIGVDQLAELPGYEEATPDQIEFMLGEAANICETLLFPLNRSVMKRVAPWKTGRCARRRGSRKPIRPSLRPVGLRSPAIPSMGEWVSPSC